MNCEIEKGDIIQLKPQFLGNLRKKKVKPTILCKENKKITHSIERAKEREQIYIFYL